MLFTSNPIRSAEPTRLTHTSKAGWVGCHIQLFFLNKEHIILIKEFIGLENGGGLREHEALRGPFIIPAKSFLTNSKRDGPLIKGSRDSVTAASRKHSGSPP